MKKRGKSGKQRGTGKPKSSRTVKGKADRGDAPVPSGTTCRELELMRIKQRPS
jgi:hypothetical protein